MSLNKFARAAMTLFVHFNFLQSFHEYYLKFPNFSFYGGRFLFLNFGYGHGFENSTETKIRCLINELE